MPNEDVNIFAMTNFRNADHRFGIKLDDRRRHMYIIGKTGMGKTQLIENMIIQDIRAGRGVAYVDPHGDTVERLLYFVPRERVNDVVYFNPADRDYPISFNVLEQVSDEQKHLMVSGLIGVFKKIWADSWGPRLEYILHHTISALVEYPGSTLLGIMRMLVDKTYRNKVIEKLTDPVVKSFWVDEYAKYPDNLKAEAIAPIQNKVGRFLSSSLMRNIVGQVKSSISVRDIMDSEKILLINLAKGRVGEDNSALLGALLITKIQLAAMSRVDTPENQRKDFYLYVDEFQNFATESFANILSEARKYRLNLIVAHQYIAQLVSDTNTMVRDAVFGNVGTIVSFRVGAADAEFLEQEFMPEFTQEDLVNLPKYRVYLKLMIDGVTSNAFSATTLPPFDLPTDSPEIRDNIIKVSRERYASNRGEIEEKISRWTENNILASKIEHQLDSAAGQGRSERGGYNLDTTRRPRSSSPSGVSGPVSTSPRPPLSTAPRPTSDIPRPVSNTSRSEGEFDAICDNCGRAIKIPFKPKSDKPIYCRECLNIPKEQRKKFVPATEHNNIPQAISLAQAIGKAATPITPLNQTPLNDPGDVQHLSPDETVKF